MKFDISLNKETETKKVFTMFTKSLNSLLFNKLSFV